MTFLIGIVVLFGAVLGGYLPHGKFEVLWQPLEFLIIAGAAMGGFIIGNPKEVILGVLDTLRRTLMGQRYTKGNYLELLTLIYTLLRLAKMKGSLALEEHADDPQKSPIFGNFPNVQKNEVATTFICDYLRMMTMGTDNAHEMEALIDEEIETRHAEMNRIAESVATVADGLPAFGIIAAVLGVITTMGSILEPPEILGGLIGAALVGTFLGIFLAYGIVGPLGNVLKDYANSDIKYFQCIKAALIAHMQGYAPALSIEFARKTLFSTERPSFIEVEDAVHAVPAPA